MNKCEKCIEIGTLTRGPLSFGNPLKDGDLSFIFYSLPMAEINLFRLLQVGEFHWNNKLQGNL